METTHCVIHGDARTLDGVPDASVHLVVTSPPYPMIGMWDGLFSALDPTIGPCLARGDGVAAFESMHRQLDPTWAACARVLVPGGLLCVNVGDATRTLAGTFRIWHNHVRILQGAAAAGFTPLPDVLWRKPTNAPTRFLGSGMLPAGAYATYEHEYVLILRKGDPRPFPTPEARANRRASAVFWEERNTLYSDVWTDLRGAPQAPVAGGRRSAAFPFDLPWRLVLMHSCYGDTVLDPFAGTGTTGLAAAAAGRNSVMLDRDPALIAVIRATVARAVSVGIVRASARLGAHRAFVSARTALGRPPGHHNRPHDVPVVTAQETDLEVRMPLAVREIGEILAFETGGPATDA